MILAKSNFNRYLVLCDDLNQTFYPLLDLDIVNRGMKLVNREIIWTFVFAPQTPSLLFKSTQLSTQIVQCEDRN